MASSKQPWRELPRCVLLRENVTRPAGFSYQEGFSSLFTLTRKLPGTRGSIALVPGRKLLTESVLVPVGFHGYGLLYPRFNKKKKDRGCRESHRHPKKIESRLST